MIPKIIHCCWFGGAQKGPVEMKCMETWKKVLPNYEIKEWHEEDVIHIQNQYFKEAWENKKWAFMADYVRLYALKKYGGIYFDTDVEVKKPLDEFLGLDFFAGSERCGKQEQLGMQVIGASKNNPLISQMLSEYDHLRFIKPDGSLNMIPNTVRFARFFEDRFGIKQIFHHEVINLNDQSKIYPFDVFSNPSDQSYTIHHFVGSWVEPYARKTVISLWGYRIVRFKKRPQIKGDELTLLKNEELIKIVKLSPRKKIALIRVNKEEK